MRGYPDWMDGLSVRARNTLFRLDCKTLNCAKKVSYVQFLRVPDCGRRTAGELCEFFGTLNSNNGTQFVNNTLWQPIETAPKDGTEFQSWLVNDDGESIGWEHKCRFNDDGIFQTWHRLDYDDYGWNNEFWFTPTHWMPLPEPPDAKEG